MIGRGFHWGMGEVGVGLLLAAIATGGSNELDLALVAGGAVLILLALRWPQRLANVVLRGINALIERIRNDQDAATAIRLCRQAAAAISMLPTRETGEVGWTQLLPRIVSSRADSEAGSIYKKRHRAATIHAIEVALGAGAVDNGALQLAESAHVDTELMELKAELLRIVLELGFGAEPHTAKA